MNLHFGLPSRKLKPVCLTIGSFDGVHRGHARVIQALRRQAGGLGVETAVLTFDPHPRCVLAPDSCPPTLTTVDEKAAIMAEMGVDHLIVLPFTRRTSRQEPAEFMAALARKVPLAGMTIGYDFTFGHQRRGNRQFLEAWGAEHAFAVQAVQALSRGGAIVSSSVIRALLLEGKVAPAARLLGRHYSISSFVEHGAGVGSRIGYPTANLAITPNKLVPERGVYAVWVDLEGGVHPGAMNVGYRPTFGGSRLTVEAFIFDFHRDVYHEEVRVRFVQRIRDEKRFSGPQALVRQIGHDVARARRILEHAEAGRHEGAGPGAPGDPRPPVATPARGARARVGASPVAG
ncbi:MAG TPA: bifunctional riboflavin kinase/FAD synthetase [Candidatus Dormibacteraeota bacterium]|jgi:riboflavin kinase/FMN adenylyltransferase|nr:bifunctional riboflavin kinase/FAD synthetase [Candidatus Dormibacteraeota bacterium]